VCTERGAPAEAASCHMFPRAEGPLQLQIKRA
jgi:hypothetical protein